jgi:hypothetical protein
MYDKSKLGIDTGIGLIRILSITYQRYQHAAICKLYFSVTKFHTLKIDLEPCDSKLSTSESLHEDSPNHCSKSDYHADSRSKPMSKRDDTALHFLTNPFKKYPHSHVTF